MVRTSLHYELFCLTLKNDRCFSDENPTVTKEFSLKE